MTPHPNGKAARARDIMRQDLVTVTCDTDVWRLAALFQDRGINGAPVVDEKGVAIGVVSQTDIVRWLREEAGWSGQTAAFYADSDAERRAPMRRATAGELMTPSVISASEDATAEELSQLMLTRGVHRIIITRDGRPCGVVATLDLLRYL